MNLARTESSRPVSHQLLPFRYVVAHHAPAALSRQSGRLLILSLIFLLLSLLLLFHYISLDDNERVRGKNWPPIVNSQDLGRCRRVSCSTWALLHPPIFEPCVHSSATSKLRHQAHSRTSPTRIRTRFLAGPSKPSSSHSRLFDPSKTWHRDPSRHCLTATRDRSSPAFRSTSPVVRRLATASCFLVSFHHSRAKGTASELYSNIALLLLFLRFTLARIASLDTFTA
jgi:hypothetical protein